MTPEQRAERTAAIAAAYAQNEKVEAIAAQFNVGLATVTRIGRAAGCARRPMAQYLLPAALIDAVRSDLEDGKLLCEIAGRHGISESTVNRIRRKSGLPNRYMANGGVDARVRAAIAGGATTTAEIVAAVGHSPSAARKACSRLVKSGAIVRVVCGGGARTKTIWGIPQ